MITPRAHPSRVPPNVRTTQAKWSKQCTQLHNQVIKVWTQHHFVPVPRHLCSCTKCEYRSYYPKKSVITLFTSSGGCRGGARGARAPLIFRPNWGPKGRKKIFEDRSPTPYHRVWVTAPLIWRPGHATDQYHPLVKMVLRVLVQCVNN